MPPGHPPKRPKIDPSRSQEATFSLLNFDLVLGSILVPFWLPKCLPLGTLLATQIDQKNDSKFDCSKCRLKIATRPPKTSPGPPQERPKTPQDHPKTPQEPAKRPPRPPKGTPRPPQDLPRAPADSPQDHSKTVHMPQHPFRSESCVSLSLSLSVSYFSSSTCLLGAAVFARSAF